MVVCSRLVFSLGVPLARLVSTPVLSIYIQTDIKANLAGNWLGKLMPPEDNEERNFLPPPA
jgi:hypothetical protein